MVTLLKKIKCISFAAASVFYYEKEEWKKTRISHNNKYSWECGKLDLLKKFEKKKNCTLFIHNGAWSGC